MDRKTVLLMALGLISLVSCHHVLDLHNSSAQTISLDLNEDFNVTWYTDNQGQLIIFEVTVRTTGWIGLGFSPAGGMRGADIIICGVDEAGNGYLEDRFASEIGYPVLDDSQDVELISASERDGVTTVSFSRSLTNCDHQDLDITSDTTRMIFAWGHTDEFSKHMDSQRGQKSVYLLDAPKPEPENDESTEDILIHDFVYESGYTLPAGVDTVYTYGIVKAPELDEITKHHVLSFDAIVTPGSEGVVHHMVVLACYHDFNGAAHLEQRMVYEAPELMPPELAQCTHSAFTWAIGGGEFHFPEHAGFPIGEADSPKWWVLNIHYDNPTKQKGKLPDFSGVRIKYSKKTRANDIGVAMVGANTRGFYIPPGQGEFYIRGDCPSECISKALPSEGVNLFGYFLHSHLLGRSITLLQKSEGEKAKVIAEDSTYDFNYQETRHLPAEVKINQNDELTVLCKMNSKGQKNVTYGGEATRDEMCMAFLYYYPKASFAICVSVQPWVTQPFSRTKAPGEKWAEEAENTEWTEEKVQEAQRQQLVSDYHSMCTSPSLQFLYNNLIVDGTSVKFNESAILSRSPITTQSCQASCKHPDRECKPTVWSSLNKTTVWSPLNKTTVWSPLNKTTVWSRLTKPTVWSPLTSTKSFAPTHTSSALLLVLTSIISGFYM